MRITREKLCRTVLVCSIMAVAVPAAADTFMVDVSGDDLTLYTDPNTGNEVKIGGFSGLFPVPNDRSGRLLYVIMDRGPVGDYGDDGKFHVVPDYNPSILTVELGKHGTAQIIEILPLKKPNGDLVTGTPNPCVPHASQLVDLHQNDLLTDLDSDSLDPEGITMDQAGNFWLCEEGRPSICMVAPDGTVVLRLVPKGTLCGDEIIPTLAMLPGVFARRTTNKGLEGITITPAGMLYAIMQRPLENPDEDTGKNSRNLRVLQIDLEELLTGDIESCLRQFLYITEPNKKQRKVYASSLFSVNKALFLVAERKTDKVFVLNMRPATNITGLEDEEGFLLADPTRTIEQLSPDELFEMHIRTIKKTEVISKTSDLDPMLSKAEGIALVRRTLVLCPDNDFNVDEEAMDFSLDPASVGLQDPENLPRIVTTHLPDFDFSDIEEEDAGE